MRTLLTLALLCCATMSEAAWPANQAVIYLAPKGMECPPCVLPEHIKADYEGVRVGPEWNAHFIVRKGPPELKYFPQVWYYDANGTVIHKEVGYQYRLYSDKTMPERERKSALRKIVERHPRFIPDKPPPAPPVEVPVASVSATVRTAELRTMADDGAVERLSPMGDIHPVQYFAYAGDCGGGGGGDFFTPPAQSYAMPYSDCGGGGGVGGGGDFFTPPAQSYYMPQYAPQQYASYGLSYAQPYRQQYVVRYVPRTTMPQFTGGGINNWSLINIQPQLGLGLGGLFSQRAYYAPRRSYRAAYSPFSYASYGSRMVCGPNGCVMY